MSNYSYLEVINQIHSYKKFGSKLGMERILFLLNALGNPQENLKVIHVAGTNGKGSTCQYIYSILLNQNYKVGLFTSPFIDEFTDRIVVNDKGIEKKQLMEIADLIFEKIDEMEKLGHDTPTEFEIITAIAFKYFDMMRVDYAVFEVGLGGRGDSTNVVSNPLISIITPIAMDHMDRLGDTIEKIAYEKAGIIKKQGTVLIHPQKKSVYELIKEICLEKEAQLHIADLDQLEVVESNIRGQLFNAYFGGRYLSRIKIGMVGLHQIKNAMVAIEAINILNEKYKLNINEDGLRAGLEKAFISGRIEILGENPTFIVDGAHNEHGIDALIEVIQNNFKNKPIVLGLGLLKDKDVDIILGKISSFAEDIVVIQPDNERALSVDQLEEKLNQIGKSCVKFKVIRDAVEYTLKKASQDHVIIFAGSLYMISSIKESFKATKGVDKSEK